MGHDLIVPFPSLGCVLQLSGSRMTPPFLRAARRFSGCLLMRFGGVCILFIYLMTKGELAKAVDEVSY